MQSYQLSGSCLKHGSWFCLTCRLVGKSGIASISDWEEWQKAVTVVHKNSSHLSKRLQMEAHRFPGGLSRLTIRLSILAQVMISQAWDQAPERGAGLGFYPGPLSRSLSPSALAPLPASLSLYKIKKIIVQFKKHRKLLSFQADKRNLGGRSVCMKSSLHFRP